MRVAVKGELYRSVAEELLDVRRVCTAREQEGGAGVAEIVSANVGQAGAAKHGLEVPVDDILGVDRRADGGGEHEVVLLPLRAGPKLLLYLTLAVAYEGFWGPLRQVYGPPGSVLGFAEDEPATLPHSLELAVYAKAPRLEVYIRPPQAQRLAHPQTAREGLAVYIAASDALGVSVDGLQAGDRNVITSATGLAIGTNFRGPVALPPCRTVYALTPHPFTYAPFGVLTGRRPT